MSEHFKLCLILITDVISKDFEYKKQLWSLVVWRAGDWSCSSSARWQQLCQCACTTLHDTHISRKDSVTEMIKKLDCDTLERRRSNARLCHIFKQANGLSGGESEQLHSLNHNFNTRYSENSYKLPPCSCDYYKWSTLSTLEQLGNGTTYPPMAQITNSTSVKSFKHAIRTATN